MANSLPWVEKYRPATLDDVIAHEDIIDTITRLINENKVPHLLFYGPPGTGKTSTILACARKMYGDNYKGMTLELNASDDRGISVVKEQIKEFASTRQIFNAGIKLIILDEADAMTTAAQAALRRVIEKYTKNTRFCLICNYVSKISLALQSRCTRFRFAPLKKEKIQTMLTKVSEAENVKIDANGIKAILTLSKGDMRNCLNILQSTVMAYDEVNEQNVYLCTGKPLPEDIRNIAAVLLNTDYANAYTTIQGLQRNKGIALADILHDLHMMFMRITKLNAKQKTYLMEQLANIENRLALGTSEELQLGALVGTCQIVRNDALGS